MSEEDYKPNSPIFVVFWTLHVSGPVEPQDVIGALYNRTKGLIGGDRGLEGLIEKGDVEATPHVNLERDGAGVRGRMHVQTRMDPERTAKLAAAFETVEEVGPGYDAEIRTESIKFTNGGRKRLAKLRAREFVESNELWTVELPLEGNPVPKEVA